MLIRGMSKPIDGFLAEWAGEPDRRTCVSAGNILSLDPYLSLCFLFTVWCAGWLRYALTP